MPPISWDDPVGSLNTPSSSFNFGGAGLAGLSMLQGLNGMFGSWMRSGAQRSIMGANSYIANIESRDALNRGQFQLGMNNTRINQVRGAQRAAMAASGINPNFGSAEDVQQNTGEVGALDALTIKNNALRDAFGYNVRSLSDSMSGNMMSNAYFNEGVGSLLTGGMRAANYYSMGYR